MLLKLWFYATKVEELNLRNLKINSKAYEEVSLWKIYERSSFGIVARENNNNDVGEQNYFLK